MVLIAKFRLLTLFVAAAWAGVLGITLGPVAAEARAGEVPAGFVDERLLSSADADIQGLYCLRFAPDGRMFVSEWRRGWLRVLSFDQASGQWTLLPEPFHRFATPDSNPASDTARRGTLRCFDFDPDFENNGLIYATYMHDQDRRGYRIVRIRQSKDDPNRSDGSEQHLFTCPFFADGAQPDAHNGGGVVVGGDGKLYVSFGDGWREEAATDLRGFAGKIVRLNRDGSIPHDNVWYDKLAGDLRAIIAVGQRNPTCLSRHPASGNVYINGFTGPAKAGMFRLVQGAHYGHGGSSKLGEPQGQWINTQLDNGGSTWACWYPHGGSWPEQYWHNAFAVNWMPTSGEIIRILGDEQHPRKQPFARGLIYPGGDGINIGPVAADIGPDGQLYYTVREYGEYTDLRRIRYLGPGAVAASERIATLPATPAAEATSPVETGPSDLSSPALALHGGNPGRGRQIFLENDGLACLKCHKYENLGGDVGPPLTDIGAKRSREQILEAIIAPNQTIEEAYVQESLVTDDGRVLSGRIEAQTKKHITLITPEGQRLKVALADIEVRRRGQSAMPEDYQKRLSLDELRDLVEFFATSGGKAPAEKSGSLTLDEHAIDETSGNLECFKISTPTATYWLDKVGAGLSRMEDKDGRDWIGFHPKPGSGAAGEWRGFPNAVYKEAGNYFHAQNAATDRSITKVQHVSDERVTITAESSNGLWGCRYDFWATHCTFTMTAMPPDRKYWVLYEGIPGGQYDDDDWWITSASKQPQPLTQRHQRDIPGPEWIAFGDKRLDDVLYLFHHEDDTHPDEFYQMQQKMTVFGFGRRGLEKYLDSVPQRFSIGFIPSTVHGSIAEEIRKRHAGQREVATDAQ